MARPAPILTPKPAVTKYQLRKRDQRNRETAKYGETRIIPVRWWASRVDVLIAGRKARIQNHRTALLLVDEDASILMGRLYRVEQQCRPSVTALLLSPLMEPGAGGTLIIMEIAKAPSWPPPNDQPIIGHHPRPAQESDGE